MEMVARSYLIYDITGSAAMLGILAAAFAVPALSLSLFGGAIVDRLSKKKLMQLSQVATTIVYVITGVTISIGYLGPAHPESWWVLMVTGIVNGAIMPIGMPARAAITPDVVSREQLTNAISLNALGMSIFQVVGPILAGYTIDWFGYDIAFYVMAALCGSAVVFTSFLPDNLPLQSQRKSITTDIKEGFKYITGDRTILFVLIFYIISVLLSMPFQLMMPIFAKDILHRGVTGQGTLMMVLGVGAIISSLILASLPSRKRGITLLLSNTLMGIALIVFAFSASWSLSLAMMVFVGVGRIGNNTAGSALLQTYTKPEYLGRVMSVMMLNLGLSGIGTFFAGILAESIGAPWSVGSFAMVLASTSALAIFILPRLSKLD
jgi:MFS family permease